MAKGNIKAERSIKKRLDHMLTRRIAAGRRIDKRLEHQEKQTKLLAKKLGIELV